YSTSQNRARAVFASRPSPPTHPVTCGPHASRSQRTSTPAQWPPSMKTGSKPRARLHARKLLSQLAPGVAAPGCLDEGGRPRAPLLRVEAEGLLHLAAVDPPELAGDELELVRYQSKGLHLCQGLDCAGGGREIGGGLGVEGPREELLPTEVPFLENPAVEEARPAAVRGHALQTPADYELHLVDWITLSKDVCVFRVQAGLQPLADRVQQPVVHVAE
ncbi:DNA-directed RNA polymerase subunit omega, partial [Striga asiatica]